MVALREERDQQQQHELQLQQQPEATTFAA